MKLLSSQYSLLVDVFVVHLWRIFFTQMYSKVKSEKKTFGLQKTADKAKKLVTVGGLSEASAEGTHCV